MNFSLGNNCTNKKIGKNSRKLLLYPNQCSDFNTTKFNITLTTNATVIICA